MRWTGRAPRAPGLREALFVDVREEDEWDEGHIPGAVHIPRGSLESRIEGSPPTGRRPSSSTAPAASARRSRRRRSRSSATRTSSRSPAASRTGSATACRRAPAGARRGEARPLQPPHPHPEVGVEGQQKLLAVARAPDRRGRARLAGVAVSRGGRSRDASASSTTTSSTRRTCSARSCTRPSASATGRRTRRADDRGAQPRRRGRHHKERHHLRERRPDPRRRVGRDHRRRRQLPDAIPHQRRLGLPRHPGRARLDLPLRGPDDRVQAARGPVLPLPLPRAAAARARAELRRRRRARRPARHHRLAPGERGDQALLGIGDRSPGGCCSSTRSRASSPRSRSAATRTAPSAASTRRSPSTSTTSSSARKGEAGTRMTTIRIPPTLRSEVGGERRFPPRAAPSASCSTT